MRAVGDVFRSQRVELNSTSWKRVTREVAGVLSEVVLLLCQLAMVIVHQDR